MSRFALVTTVNPFQRYNPFAVGLSGLCLGPIGLGYSLTIWPDMVFTGAVLIASYAKWADRGVLLAFMFTAAYGVCRAVVHNARLDATEQMQARADVRAAAEAMRDDYARDVFMHDTWELVDKLEARGISVPGVARPVVLEAVPVVVELEAPVLPVPTADALQLVTGTAPATPASAGGDPPPPPTPPKAPAKRGRPKGSRKLAA